MWPDSEPRFEILVTPNGAQAFDRAYAHRLVGEYRGRWAEGRAALLADDLNRADRLEDRLAAA